MLFDLDVWYVQFSIYIYVFVYKKKKGWQVVAHKSSYMCNLKDCSWDEIEDMICGEGLWCVNISREETLDIW